ncbi:MAG: replicative DNA helicase [Firmicutes bacterium HGW-Firmicutes-1]|nr:MAG: replicative DNA helicase [Firmicutes bacterium HGW-Firmicutes-1]
MEESIKRIPPHSIEAEQSVIGSMVMDREAIGIALENIDGDDFYQPDLKAIFDAMVNLYQHNQPVDLVTLQTKLKDLGQLDMVGGIDYLSKLAIAVPTSAHIENYAQIVKEKSILRKLIKAGQEIIADGYEGKERLEGILNGAEEKIFNIIQGRKTGEFSNISKIVSDSLDMISEAYLNKGQVTGVATGFPDLDHKTAGLQASDLILIAARPSMGKTAFAINVAQHAAVKERKSVAIFSLEMSKEQLARRMLCTQGLVDAQKVRIGDLTEEEWLNLIDASTIVGQAPIFIDDTPGVSVNEIRAKCRKLKLEKGLDLILIDYLQLMSGNSKKESRQQEISEISRGLKGLAREMEAPVIALSQLSRACETRADHRPILSDLRESGAIEQDADIVMFLYRDEYYNEDSEFKNQAELIIAKQRNGQTGTVHLAWLGAYTKFASSTYKKES